MLLVLLIVFLASVFTLCSTLKSPTSVKLLPMYPKLLFLSQQRLVYVQMGGLSTIRLPLLSATKQLVAHSLLTVQPPNARL